MKYSTLVEVYEQLSSTTKRLEKIEIISKFFMRLEDKDKDILYLFLGNVFPEYDERKIGISTQLIIKAISKTTGVNENEIIKEWKQIGDLGEVTKKLIKIKKQSTLSSHTLTIEKVISNLRKLPELEGKGTIDKKISLITELLTSASPEEALYIVRTILSDLRIGIKESTLREAMNNAFFNGDKESSKKIEDVLNKKNDIAEVFELVKKRNLKNLNKISLDIGKPIKVMLAQKTKTIQDGFKEVGKPAAIEYKYDGFRLEIHKNKEEIKLFTRGLENVTKQFSEVVEYVKNYVKGDSFIIDSEAVGYDPQTKSYLPFQNISQRIKRKYHIQELQKKLPVEINVFDILSYNNKSLLNEPFEKRTELIKKIIIPQKLKIVPAKQLITDNEKQAEEFYKQALKDNQEGIMMKNLKAEYKPGKRVGYMLKIKPDIKELDLVLTGAEYGTGKRSGWLSSFILSCKNGDEFLEIGKVGTGIKEKNEEGISFEELTKLIKPYILKEIGKEIQIKPKIVISVSYQEIQKSPTYSSGFALRFPKFISLRPDRSIESISTLSEIQKDYENQNK